MPAENAPPSAETIGQRLARLRGDLADVRAAIKRGLNNGAITNLQGNSVTEISLERLEAREKKLAAEITALEARIAGGNSGTTAAQLVTRFD